MSIVTTRHIEGGLFAPWVTNERVTLYTLRGTVYLSLANLCALTARDRKYVSRHAPGYIIDRKVIAPPETHWSDRRLDYVIRFDDLFKLLPILVGWNDEKITAAMAQFGVEEEEEEDSSSSALPLRKRTFCCNIFQSEEQVKRTRNAFIKDSIWECEMTEDVWKDTIHRVEILEVLGDGKYLCRMFGFDILDTFECDENELHELRAAEPNAQYRVGERVHFLYINRRVNGKKVDGLESTTGVWVKGDIEHIDQAEGSFAIRHINWSDETMALTGISRLEIRKGY